MESVLDDLRARARILHAELRAGAPDAAKRLRGLRELSALEGDALVLAVQRKHCLSVIARELGFDGWQHAVSVLEGREGANFGTLLHAPSCAGHWNIWSASYDEAEAIRREHGGYLLPYKHQFMIVDRHYIESLGLDHDDASWEAMGRDWARPTSVAARAALCARLVRQRERSTLAERPLQKRL
jgi:hypothetical protein